MDENGNHQTQALEILRNKTAYAFEGGGTLGFAHVAALERLHNLGGLKSISHVCGSSVGSIVGCALAAGASVEYMKQKLFNMDLITFQDNDNNKLRDLYQLLKFFGKNKTQKIKNFVGEILNDLTKNSDITFIELYNKTNVHLTVTYLSLNHNKTMYADHVTEPDTIIKDAVTKSSTIPLFYEADWESILGDNDAPLCGKPFNKKLFNCSVDGGTLDNYPIHVLREQGCAREQIIGFKFISDGELNCYDYTYSNQPSNEDIDNSPKNFVDFLMRLAMIGRTQAMHVHVDKNDWELTVKTNVGKLTSTEFNMTTKQKDWLYNQGIKGVNDHLAKIEKTLEDQK